MTIEGNTIYEQTVQIKDIIRAVQNQLIESEKDRIDAGIPRLFSVKELELEMSFVIEETTSSDCGVSLKIVDAKGQEEKHKEKGHKLRILLTTIPPENIENCDSINEHQRMNTQGSNSFFDILSNGYYPNKSIPENMDN